MWADGRRLLQLCDWNVNQAAVMHLNGFDSEKHATHNAELSALREKLLCNASSIEAALLAAQREEEEAEVPALNLQRLPLPLSALGVGLLFMEPS